MPAAIEALLRSRPDGSGTTNVVLCVVLVRVVVATFDAADEVIGVAVEFAVDLGVRMSGWAVSVAVMVVAVAEAVTLAVAEVGAVPVVEVGRAVVLVRPETGVVCGDVFTILR